MLPARAVSLHRLHQIRRILSREARGYGIVADSVDAVASTAHCSRRSASLDVANAPVLSLSGRLRGEVQGELLQFDLRQRRRRRLAFRAVMRANRIHQVL